MIVLPQLSDYDVSAENGFLAPTAPLLKLSDPYYEPWERVIQNLHGLILSKRLHETVDGMSLLEPARLFDEAQWRRAYSILAFITHAYIWSDKQPREWVPPNLSIPFMACCKHLQLPPVATYAGLVLWNWKPIFDTEPSNTLANLDMVETFTGSLDEKWFYLISVAIEAKGAPLIPLMLSAMKAADENDSAAVAAALRIFAEQLDVLGAILARMYENCDPHVFYHRLRPFLAGSKNMAGAGLPNGVVFDNGGPMNKQKYVQFSGGSNAQSSLLQFFDIVLGVQHRVTGVTKSAPPDALSAKPSAPAETSFIHEMRQYMPGSHARFLEAVDRIANIREFVIAHSDDHELMIAFDASLAMLSSFRDKHIQIVSRYIVVKSRENKSEATEVKSLTMRPRNIATPSANEGPKQKKLVGTGGTSLIPFLRQARDETGEAAVASWTRQLLDKSRSHTSAL